MIISLPEGYKGIKLWLIIPSPCIFSLQSTTIVQILYTVVCKNNIEVAVNTCTCTDVITTKDQSGGIYNSYSTGGQRFKATVNKPHRQATPWDLVCLLP